MLPGTVPILRLLLVLVARIMLLRRPSVPVPTLLSMLIGLLLVRVVPLLPVPHFETMPVRECSALLIQGRRAHCKPAPSKEDRVILRFLLDRRWKAIVSAAQETLQTQVES